MVGGRLQRERQKEDEKSNLCVRKRKKEIYIDRERGRRRNAWSSKR